MSIEEGKRYIEKKIGNNLAEKNITVDSIEWKEKPGNEYEITVHANGLIEDKTFKEKELLFQHKMNLERKILGINIQLQK